jgi:hypothetical protein
MLYRGDTGFEHLEGGIEGIEVRVDIAGRHAADRDFKAHFAWCPPIARTRNTPRERPLVGAQTTRLTRKTPPSAPRDVSRELVLATRGPRDDARAHRGHSRS